MRKGSQIVTMGSLSGPEIARAIGGLLGRFSDPIKTGQEFRDHAMFGGVAVSQNGIEEDIMRFQFITHDDCCLDVRVDLRALDKEYLDKLVAGVSERIADHRKRRERSFVPDILTKGVSEAIH